LDAVKRYYDGDIILYNKMVDRLLKAKGFSGKRSITAVVEFLGFESEEWYLDLCEQQVS
jgi:hypothetical protein